MTSQLNTYLHFRGNAKQALEFYKSVFGGEVETTTFANGGMPYEEADADLVMHGQLTVSDQLHFFVSDTPSTMEYAAPAGISLSLNGDDDDELTGYFTKLSQGGGIDVPMATAPWGDKFGMLTDQFGISWMVNVAPAAKQ